MNSARLQNELTDNADTFARTLNQMALAIDGDISAVVRNSILRVFGSIIKRSPVDTGAYRASHGIANLEPTDEEGIVRGGKSNHINVNGKRVKVSNNVIAPPTSGWTWKVGDGDIWLYNNVPYAERIEDGWSQGQAPAGVYRLALVELTAFMQAEIVKYISLGYMGGGGE